MKLRGNFLLFHCVEFLTGILLVFLFKWFGDVGLIGIILYFVALLLTGKKKLDEREIFLGYKINNWESIVIGTSTAIIYFYFPAVNWFYALTSISLISRGLIGFFILK